MLTEEENELLCRVGPGTVMGDMMRQYWLPFLYSWEVNPDGPPLRVRLLGEDLIAFRSSSGQVGLIADRCAHRGGGLFFGRNEEEGLRCVYHGWKYSVAGACVDMPNEPAESDFKNRIFIKSYRCAEQGGMVWAYLGPLQANAPGLPQFEWAQLPEKHVHHQFKAIRKCNYLQALEGDIDSSHIGFLHSKMFRENTAALSRRDKAPRLEVLDTDYGTMYAARRTAGPGQYYWRSAQFVLPFHTFFPASATGNVPGHIWVPIDDDLSLTFGLSWNPVSELSEGVGRLQTEAMGAMREEQKGKFFAHWWPVAATDNDFLIDHELQAQGHFTGLPTTGIEDMAMTISMGAIMDRPHEHLGTTDAMIIQSRQRLLRSAVALREQGTPPPTVEQPDLCRVRSCSAILPEGVDWQTALEDWHLARTTRILPSQAAALSG